MGYNTMILSTKMPLNEVIEFCEKWNKYHDNTKEWNEDEIYVDYDEELEKKFVELIDWRGIHQIRNWMIENIEKHCENPGLFLITREQVNELAAYIDKTVKELSSKLGPNHDINDYLIDNQCWNYKMENFSDAYSHFKLESAQRNIKKLLELLDADSEINLVYIEG